MRGHPRLLVRSPRLRGVVRPPWTSPETSTALLRSLRLHCSPCVPPNDNPGQQPDRQRNRNRGVGDSQLFEITEAASSRRQFPVDGGVKSVVLEAEAAKR